jgi:CRP-like cAMP-binding protein
MSHPPHETSDFLGRLGQSIRDEQPGYAAVRVPKHGHVYHIGDSAETVYFIESGQVKLLMLSPEGKECLLGIHVAGDVFGESCLQGASRRHEMATAMENTALRCIPSAVLFEHLGRHAMVEGFVRHLVTRIADQQQIIAHLMTVDSEHRLGQTLLALARKLGKQDPRNNRIGQKITHEELSQMVGTTRPRVTKFMLKFRLLGLITVSPEHFLIVDEKKLAAFLT